MASPLVLLTSLMGLVALAMQVMPADARAVFVFGDSLVDSGNNNFLVTSARANMPPYGIDTPSRIPTGRFSNGLNIADLISIGIGEEPTLPYLSPELKGERLLSGANFASAGIGILNDTGIQFVNIIRMFKQYELFEQYQQRVAALIGAAEAQQLVNQALYLITVGGNDFVNNYYLVPYSARSRQFSLPDYVDYIISEYKKLLVRIYELGARRVIVTGTGPIGCVPAELAQRSPSGVCALELQRAAGLYNPQLEQMLLQLNSQLGTDVFIAANTNRMATDFIYNPQAYGFVTSRIACCGQGLYNGIGLCTVFSNLCPDRNLYAFWDAFHPTEKANRIIVNRILSGTTAYIKPMNLSSLLALEKWA
ncbi:hypothetical protein ACLOJK_007565 [Asimina triloba]